MELSTDALLFDSDGVLVASEAAVEKAWRQLAEEFQLDADHLLTELVGVPSADTLGRYLDPTRCAEAVALLEDLEVELSAGIAPVRGARELLDSLPAARWAIVTSASARLGAARWDGAGIPTPGVVVSADDVTHGKPGPEPYLTAAERLSVPIDRCVVFEDSPSGARSATSAGARVVAVGGIPWPLQPAARVPDLEAVKANRHSDYIHLTIDKAE